MGFTIAVAMLALLVLGNLALAATFLARRHFPRALVGQEASAVTEFRGGLGRVFVHGKEWPAELAAESEAVEAGALLRVVGVSGSRLKVRGV